MTTTSGAEVTLDRCYINLLADPTQQVAANSASPSDQIQQTGDFRGYGNGRIRQVATPTVIRTVGRTLRYLSQADADLVQSWRGQTIVFRDSYGRRVVGSFLQSQRVDIRGSAGMVDLTLQITELTVDESV